MPAKWFIRTLHCLREYGHSFVIPFIAESHCSVSLQIALVVDVIQQSGQTLEVVVCHTNQLLKAEICRNVFQVWIWRQLRLESWLVAGTDLLADIATVDPGSHTLSDFRWQHRLIAAKPRPRCTVGIIRDGASWVDLERLVEGTGRAGLKTQVAVLRAPYLQSRFIVFQLSVYYEGGDDNERTESFGEGKCVPAVAGKSSPGSRQSGRQIKGGSAHPPCLSRNSLSKR